MTEPDQRDKDPKPAGKWVNAAARKALNQTRAPSRETDSEGVWEEALAGLPTGLPAAEEDEEPEEARAETPGKIKGPDYM